MSISAILIAVSIGAFFLSKFAGSKAKSIFVSEDVKMDESRIAELGLYKGQPVEMYNGNEQNKVILAVYNGDRERVDIHSFTNNSMYDILKKKAIYATIFSIYGDLVTVEIKFLDAL